MRVGLVVYGDLCNRSGGYLYDAKLVEELGSRGHEVEVISLERGGYREEVERPPLPEILERVRAERIDLLIEDELAHPSLIQANKDLKGSLPIVSIVHNLSCQVALAEPERDLYARHEREYLRGVDALIYNSQATRAAVEGLIDSRPHGHVAPPGRDHLRAGAAAERDYRADALEILYVGNLLPYKGLDTLVLALSELERGRFKLWAAGAALDQDFLDRVEELIRRGGIEEETFLLRRIDECRLLGLLDRAHVLAVPSLHEGYGLVYVEAMGHGLPVLASASGGAREFVEEGVQGFLVPPGDHECLAMRLDSLFKDRELLQRMSGESRAKFFSMPTWRQSMRPAVEFMERIVASFHQDQGE